MSCLSSPSPTQSAIPLLDRLDPHSPATTVPDVIHTQIESQDELFATEFCFLDLQDLYSDNEESGDSLPATSEDLQPSSGPQGRLREASLQFTLPTLKCDAIGNMDDTTTVSTPIEDSPATACEDISWNDSLCFRGGFQYYSDMRSLYPIALHVTFLSQHFQLFCDMQSTMFDARLALMPNADCLEVGCGAGHWAKAFANTNPMVKVFGVDSTCFGPRIDSDPPNYQFFVSDLINTHQVFPFEITASTAEGRFDYIRCTRINGRVCSWSHWCHKMYQYAKEGGYIEIYDVLPDSTVQKNGRQPAWEMIPFQQHTCSEMSHRPNLQPRECARPSRIEEYLRDAGFTRIQKTWRDLSLNPRDPSSLLHIESLISQASHLAHLIGMSLESVTQHQASLWHEALEYGLTVRSFTICAQKVDPFQE